MTSSCSDMRLYETGFMFLGDFIPFNMIQIIEIKLLGTKDALLLIYFIYRPSEPENMVICQVKDVLKKIFELIKVLKGLRETFEDHKEYQCLIPIYETDRPENYDFRGKLIYPRVVS